MNIITLFLSDGQIFKRQDNGTIPQLQRKYAIGKTIKNTNLTIEANTIE